MTQSATLLLTRPLADSLRFAEQVRASLGDMRIAISPLLEIELSPLDRGAADAKTIVFTSRNGVAAWERAKLPCHQRCFCVGSATGDAARALGFDPFISGGTVDHLLEDMRAAAPDGPILHVHGRFRAGDLIGALRKDGFDIRGLLAYEQKPIELDQHARALLSGGEPVIVPLFSPRSAAQFAKTGLFQPQIDIIAISRAAAKALPSARIAPSPDAKGMIAAISQGHSGLSTP